MLMTLEDYCLRPDMGENDKKNLIERVRDLALALGIEPETILIKHEFILWVGMADNFEFSTQTMCRLFSDVGIEEIDIKWYGGKYLVINIDHD